MSEFDGILGRLFLSQKRFLIGRVDIELFTHVLLYMVHVRARPERRYVSLFYFTKNVASASLFIVSRARLRNSLLHFFALIYFSSLFFLKSENFLRPYYTVLLINIFHCHYIVFTARNFSSLRESFHYWCYVRLRY